jgi:hypothetical protein
LVDELAQDKARLGMAPLVPLPGAASTATPASTSSTAPPGAAAVRPSATSAPQMLQFFRRTWSRLSAEQRLAQSRSAVPENAGPLHSQHLMHQCLTRLRDLSPDYFEQFIAHVDALLWLEQNQTLPTRVPSPAAPLSVSSATRSRSK